MAPNSTNRVSKLNHQDIESNSTISTNSTQVSSYTDGEINLVFYDNAQISANNSNSTSSEVGVVQETVEPAENYVLPARRNRGIPPVGYEPKYSPEESQYQVVNLVRWSLLPVAHAFIASVYTQEIPKTIETSRKNSKWCQSIKIELEVLGKNMTWDKCFTTWKEDNKALVGVHHKALWI